MLYNAPTWTNDELPAINDENLNVISKTLQQDGIEIANLQTSVSSPYNFKGNVSTVSSLPSSGNTVNDTYYVTSAMQRYTWNGNDWYPSSLSEADYEDNLAALKLVQENLMNARQMMWVQGQIAPGNGVYYPGAAKYVCDPTFYAVTPGTVEFYYIPQGFRLVILCYDQNQTYLGRYLTNATNTNATWSFTIPVEGTEYSGATTPSGSTAATQYVRFCVHYTPTLSALTPAEASEFCIFETDEGKAGLVRHGGRALGTNEDFGTLYIPGTYFIPSGYTLTTPVQTPCFLFIDNIDGYIIQRFLNSYAMAWRRTRNPVERTNASGIAWTAYGGTGYAGIIPGGSDLDDIVVPGTYYKSSSASSVLNSPNKNLGWLEVMGLGSSASGQLLQRFTTSSGQVYVRHRTSSAVWGSWKFVNPPPPLATLDQDQAVGITTSVAPTHTTWTPLETTGYGIPITSGAKVKAGEGPPVDKTVQWDVYPAGEPVDGLPYSSVSNKNGTLFYQRTLEAFYSAVENPNSILYTQQAYQPWQGNLAASMYGTACSGFASAVLGFKILYNTASLMELGTPVTISNITQVKPGLLLLRKVTTVGQNGSEGASYHTVIVTSVQLMTDGTYSVTTAEAVAPLTKEVVRNQTDFMALLNGASPYKAYDFGVDFTEGYTPITLGEYATDMIPEYGNNTWMTYGTYENRTPVNIWFSDPTVTTIYVKRPGQTAFDPPVSVGAGTDYPIDENGVCNLANAFYECGIWEFTSNAGNVGTDPDYYTPAGKVAIINTGTYSYDSSSHTYTFSGFDGCEPSWYEFVIDNAGASARISEEFDPDDPTATVPAIVYSQPEQWWIAVYYDTGFACCRVLYGQ